MLVKLRRDRKNGKKAEIQESREKKHSGYFCKKLFCSESTGSVHQGSPATFLLPARAENLPCVLVLAQVQAQIWDNAIFCRQQNCSSVTSTRLSGWKDDLKSGRCLFQVWTLLMVGGWGMWKREKVATGAACWRAAYTPLLSLLLCSLVPLDNWCPAGPQKVGWRCAGRGGCSPQLGWPSATFFLCSQRKGKKPRAIHKVVSLYCLSISFFLETSQCWICREQSCLLWVLKLFTGMPPLTPRTAEDACSGNRTLKIFSEGINRLNGDFIFFSK